MIVRAEAFLQKLRHACSRSVWAGRLLNLAVHPATVQPGLVMVQIDGLGHTQFERAQQEGNLPFLSRLIRKEGYVNHRHYSGVPSNTPAVQGVLFYGVKACVPAFSFKDSASGQIFNMFYPPSAAAVEDRIKGQGEALLKGGSAYGNIFTGGASEAHFCAAAIGWGSLLKAVHPLGAPVTIVLNLHIFVRALFLILVEFVLAVSDAVRGVLSGKNLLTEIQFIPFRVTICILLREIITAGARIDIARGLPVIHVNLAGYDEQAHHRGPTSMVAHWTLRGIDRAIERIWRAARTAQRRDYDVFIYSDHGQEEAVGYAREQGRSVQDAVQEVFKDKMLSGHWKGESSRGVPYWRAELIRNAPSKRLQAFPAQAKGSDEPSIVMTAMGPVGHIYPPQPLSDEEKERFARELVASAKIPMVMMPGEAGRAFAWTPKGKFSLPDDADKVVEETHPFFAEVVRDLVELCHHPDAGNFLIFGWRSGTPSLTFPSENGSHAGPGAEETSGFALLPVDALARAFGKTIHTQELREAAFRALGRGDDRSFFRAEREQAPSALRVMTYNVHSCLGRDGKLSPNRIARVIARHNPDVVALQELATDERAHQAEIIAQKLAMTFQFRSALSLKKGARGNAIFSKFPIRPVHSETLPRFSNRLLEPRGALWIEIDVNGKRVQILNTHLSLFPREGLLQTEALLSADWMGNPACRGPVIFCGDLNAFPNSKICRRLGQRLRNAQTQLAGHRALNTLPSFYPFRLVDHIFVSPGIRTTKVEVPNTELERVSSDHLPLIVDVLLEEEKDGA